MPDDDAPADDAADAPAPRLERALIRVGDRALAPRARSDHDLIAALVASTVAVKKDRITRELSYGAGLAGVGVMAMSWVAVPLLGVLGAQWWWHRRRHPGRVPGRLSIFETPDEVERVDAARIGLHAAQILVTARDGRRIALYCDASRLGEVLEAMQRVAPGARTNLLGMAPR